MAKKEPRKPDAILGAFERADADVQRGKRCTLSFDQFFHQYQPAPDYLYGRHTHALIGELQHAADVVDQGGQYFAIVNMPPRHGKSDVCSRRFPPWFLATHPDLEAIIATYGADLSLDLSHSARKCFDEAGQRFGLRLSEDRNQLGAWRIEGHRGGLIAVGIGGALTGRGGSIIIIDDYLKSRAEAESETIRNSIWDAFRSDIITRGAPAHAVIIVATRWHPDDLVGRILEQMEKDPEFPKFKIINFPAQAEDGSWLFPERYSEKYYTQQRAIVGPYAWEALYQGNPKPRTGQLLRSDLVNTIDAIPEDVFKKLKWVRSWDLASSEKERVKDDPDYTVGTKIGYYTDAFYVADVIRGQWAAPERDQKILDAALKDGPRCTVRIETVAGYKDTFTRIRAKLAGKATVRNSQPLLDKVARASLVEPSFEAGKVSIVRAPWNHAWLAELSAFPRGKHDDQVDSFVIGAEEHVSSSKRMGLSY